MRWNNEYKEWLLLNKNKYSFYIDMVKEFNKKFSVNLTIAQLRSALRRYTRDTKIRKNDNGCKWKKEHYEWVMKNKNLHKTYSSLANSFNEYFNEKITYYGIVGLLRKNDGNAKISDNNIWNEEMNNWLKEIYPFSIKNVDELAIDFNKKFKTNISGASLLSHCNKKLKLKKDNLNNYFSQRTHISQKYPLLSEYYNKSNGYTYIKVNDVKGTKKNNFAINWTVKQRYIYEQYYGEIPNGYDVIFADGNSQNFDIANLILMSKRERMRLMSNNLFIRDKKVLESSLEVIKTNILIDDMIGKKSKRKDTDFLRLKKNKDYNK